MQKTSPMARNIHFLKLFISGFCLFVTLSATIEAQVVINEFSAANVSGPTDNYGNREDWIELFNTTGASVSMAGWYLSDDVGNPTKWQFPAGINIAANGFIRVWASGRNIVTGTNYHTNFKINQTQSSEGVVLANPSGVIVDQNPIDVPNQADHSWGRSPNGSANWRVFTTPTPNASNTGANYIGYASTPNVIPASGGYTGASLSVSITSPDAGVTIRYTNNGDFPVAGSTLYSGPFNITQTRVIRAYAIPSDPNYLPSFVETNTYFLNVAPHTVKILSLSGAGVQTLLGGTQSSPRGGYELFDEGFNKIDEGYAEFNKHGNDSWAYQQRGLDMIVRDQFGYDHAVKEQIFVNTPRNRFQRLILKPAANDNYPFQNGGAHIRDAYVHTLSQRANLELDERTNEPCVLYVNGNYWGCMSLEKKWTIPILPNFITTKTDTKLTSSKLGAALGQNTVIKPNGTLSVPIFWVIIWQYQQTITM